MASMIFSGMSGAAVADAASLGLIEIEAMKKAQILILLEVEEDHLCGKERFVMKAGDVCIHPPNVPHGGSTKKGFRGIDFFRPPREDHVKELRKVLRVKK